jgi:hypothetical protein
MPIKVAPELEIENIEDDAVADTTNIGILVKPDTVGDNGVEGMTIDRMEGGVLEAEQQQQQQSTDTKRSCMCCRFIAQCFLGALATFFLTLFIDIVLLSHDAIVGGALLGFGVGLFGAGIAIAITQLALWFAGRLILYCITSKEEQARAAGRDAANTEPLWGQCIRENGRFLVKKSLGKGINEPCLGEAPTSPPEVSECFDNDKAPGCAPIDTVGQGTLVGVVTKAYVLAFDLCSSISYAITISLVHEPDATICASVDYIASKSACTLSGTLGVSDDARKATEREANSKQPVPWYGGPDPFTSKERHDKGVIDFLNENGGDTEENRRIARNLDVNVQGNGCMIS